ncbi:MAG: hypothetical protein AAGA84_00240 [Pseudomonadota bacterium]
MIELRKDYDPSEVPLNSTASIKIDPSVFDLELAGEDDTVEQPDLSNATIAQRLNISEPTMTVKTRSPWLMMQQLTNRLVFRILVSRRYQLGFVLLTVGSVLLIYWSLNSRVSHVSDNTLALQELTRVESQILQLQSVWSETKMADIKAKVASADARRVFPDYRSLARWLREKSTIASSLGLDFSYTLSDAQSSELADVLQAPIEVKLSKEGGDDTYFQSLEFFRQVVSSVWHVEILEASFTGDGSGTDAVSATLRVWVHTDTLQERANVQ